MGSVKRFQDLLVWQKALELSVDCYEITKSFPPEERFGLTSQIRRSAASIYANIAEGWGRQRPREFKNFLLIALGSIRELEAHLEFVKRLGFISEIEFLRIDEQIVEISKMLYVLEQKIDVSYVRESTLDALIIQ